MPCGHMCHVLFCGWLSSCSEQQEPIAEEKARRVIRQLLQALEYLHFQKVPTVWLVLVKPYYYVFCTTQIIHRDIKPGNLLLTKGDVLKVADFGVSFMYDGEDDTVQSSAGTAAFLAPELCSGQATSGKVCLFAPSFLVALSCVFLPFRPSTCGQLGSRCT